MAGRPRWLNGGWASAEGIPHAARGDPDGTRGADRRVAQDHQHGGEFRVVPSTILALALAQTLGTTVEQLFYIIEDE